jgi:hypothetical protein
VKSHGGSRDTFFGRRIEGIIVLGSQAWHARPSDKGGIKMKTLEWLEKEPRDGG